jgi:hypothetical protein
VSPKANATAGCSCLGVLALCWLLAACGVFRAVTPADRAAGYAAEAKAISAACKAYRFDRAAGLVPEVPAMAELCK